MEESSLFLGVFQDKELRRRYAGMRLRRYSITASVPLATIAARGARKGFPSRLRHLWDRTAAPQPGATGEAPTHTHPPEASAQAQLRRHLQHVVVGQVQRGQAAQPPQAAGIQPAHLVVAQHDGLQGEHAIEDLGEGPEPVTGGAGVRPWCSPVSRLGLAHTCCSSE